MSKIPLAFVLFLSVLCATSSADTVTLSSGEKLQGKISAESASEITLDIKVSESISDQRIIPRNQIQKIEKTPQDDLDFDQLNDLKPDPLVAKPAMIEGQIGKLKEFLAKYPESSHATAVKTIMGVFQKEKDHLAAGEVKYFGRWISKAEAANRKVQLDGVAYYASMRDEAARGDFIGALNEFDRLEKNGGNTRVYPQAVALASKILEALSQQLTHSIAKLKHDVEEWTQGLTVTPETQKPQIIAAKKAEQDRYEALMEATQKSGAKWTPLLPDYAKSLDSLAALCASESTRLSALPVDKMNASVQDVDKARDALDTRDNEMADSLLKDAVALWPQNEDATYLQKSVSDLKAEAAKAAEAAAKATPKPTATAKPSASQTPKPASTPLPVVEEEKPSLLAFFMTIPGAMSVVGGAIVLLIIVTVLQKMKKPKQGDVE